MLYQLAVVVVAVAALNVALIFAFIGPVNAGESHHLVAGHRLDHLPDHLDHLPDHLDHLPDHLGEYAPAGCFLNAAGECVPDAWRPRSVPTTGVDLIEESRAVNASPCVAANDNPPAPRVSPESDAAASRFLELQHRHRARGGDPLDYDAETLEALADWRRARNLDN